jgi:hypothetical protein
MLLVLSHVDRLRPLQEWHPPYDLTDAADPKAASIRAAIEAAGTDLGFSPEGIVPVCLDPAIGIYNVNAVWAAIMERMADAQRTQLVRCLGEAGRGLDWRRIRKQTWNAGRALAGAILAKDDLAAR